jgi:hypothetical protein
MLCKTISADGAVVPHGLARRFDLRPEPLRDFDALAALLERLLPRRDAAVVRGAITDRARTGGVRRLLHPDAETGDAPTLRDVPRRWAALDVDGLPLPRGCDPRDLAACAAVVLLALPAPFRNAELVAQATAGHGVKPGAHLRLLFWLSRPASGTELKEWLRGAPVDRAVFGAAQPIFTAAPLFAGGGADHLPRRLLRLNAGRGAVPVPPPLALLPSPCLLPRPARRIGDADEGARDRLQALARFAGGAPPQHRNSRLYWAACRAGEMVASRLATPAVVARILIEAGCRTGLAERETAATVASGLRAGAGRVVA